MSFQNILTLGSLISVCSWSLARGDLSPQKRRALECTSIIAICPTGWMLFSGGCYKHEDTASTWDGAEIACIADESHLVEINNAAENTFLANVIKNSSLYSIIPSWIGLNDREINGTHIWYSSGNVANYTNWNANEPNDVTGQACVQMYSTGQWDDVRCSFKRHFICERSAKAICPTGWTFFREGCYKLEYAAYNWDDAQDACIADESRLVEINNAAENTFLADFIKNSSLYPVIPAWIGLNDRENNGTYIWHYSGNVTIYTNWDAYEPNYVSGQDCVHIHFTGRWNNMHCSHVGHSICERPAEAIAHCGLSSQKRHTVLETCQDDWSLFNRRCYRLSSTKANWETAQIRCSSVNATLVNITCAAENEFLVNLRHEPGVIKPPDAWIGLYVVNDTYTWYPSGNTTNYTNWAIGQPDNDQNMENCVEMYEDGKWNDNDCSKYRRFFCEKSSFYLPYYTY